MTTDLAWAVMGKGSTGQLSIIEGLVSIRIQGNGGKQVLAPIVLQQTGWSASIIVFGPKGLVLESSMDLIPTETILIFYEGNIYRYKL